MCPDFYISVCVCMKTKNRNRKQIHHNGCFDTKLRHWIQWHLIRMNEKEKAIINSMMIWEKKMNEWMTMKIIMMTILNWVKKKLKAKEKICETMTMKFFDSETTRSTFWIADVDVDVCVCVCVHVLIIWDGIIIDHCGISLFID